MEPRKVFSIVIPVYNVEKQLEQCIDSVLTQTFSDFEFLLINDGSTDSSLKICLEYQKKDSRIKVIDKENGGASSARNEGIKNATGDYLIFVDSDDFIESENLVSEINLKIIQNSADVILYGAKNFNLLTNSYSISRGNYNLEVIEKFNFLSTVDYLILNNLFPGSAWVFATKTSVVQQNELYFRTNIIAEDIDWVTKIFRVINKVDAVNDVYYIYRKNQDNSVTGNAGVKGINSIVSIIEDWFPKLSKTEKLDRYLLHNLGYYYFTTLVLFAKITNKERPVLLKKLQQNFQITQFVKTRKLKVLRFLCQVFGINFVSRIISKLYYIKEKLV